MIKDNEFGFQLLVRSQPEGTYFLDLLQKPPSDSRPEKRKKSTFCASIRGWRLDSALALIKRSLKESGYKPSDLKRSRKTPFKLDEKNGVKMHLLFIAIQDIQKRSKVEDIIFGIDDMSREEALYWHSKIEGDKNKHEKRGLKALRILLGGD